MTSSGEIMLHLPDGETDIINDQGTTLGMLMQSDNHTHDEAAAHENLASRVRSTIHGIAAPAEVLAETMKKGLNKVSNAADQLVQAVRSDLAGGNVELADVSICRNRWGRRRVLLPQASPQAKWRIHDPTRFCGGQLPKHLLFLLKEGILGTMMYLIQD
eukprot:767734-Hanusia_phi.AAC.10